MNENSTSDMTKFFSGTDLYGNSFSQSEIEEWYEDEKEGYYQLYETDGQRKDYGNHALNFRTGFRFLHDRQFKQVLGFGSGNCDEFLPILTQCDQITVVDSSNQYKDCIVGNTRISYHQPKSTGKLAFPDSTFDLIVCMDCLHHIPNVEFVMSELIRCLRPGGFAYIREPTISMGDWRTNRVGLTKNERGIPLHFFNDVLNNLNIRIVSSLPCSFPLLQRLNKYLPNNIYNYKAGAIADHLFSKMFLFNYRYHATKFWHKLRPVSVAYVLRKNSE